jgi:hypothetical protein
VGPTGLRMYSPLPLRDKIGNAKLLEGGVRSVKDTKEETYGVFEIVISYIYIYILKDIIKCKVFDIAI